MMANRPEAQKHPLCPGACGTSAKAGPWKIARRYFQFLQKARRWSGGASYQGFINNIDREAFENASEAERLADRGHRRP